MKVALAILATLAIASPLYAYRLPASGSGALANELQKMVDLMPLGKMLEITKAYAAQDKQMSTVISVLKTNEMKQLAQDIESDPVFKEIVKKVQDLGLDIRALINLYNEKIGLAPLAPLADSNVAITGGILGYLKDVGDTVPLEQLTELVNKELQNSKVFQDFVNTVAAPENADFYWSIYKNPHFLSLKQQATKQGVSGLLFQEVFPMLVFASAVV